MDDFSEFHVSQRRFRDTVIVCPDGEIDMATVDQLRAALRSARQDARRVVLDLRGVSLVDSSGLNRIVEIDRDARRDSFSLSVLTGPAAVQRLFEIAGLTAQLAFVEDLAQVGGDDGETGV